MSEKDTRIRRKILTRRNLREFIFEHWPEAIVKHDRLFMYEKIFYKENPKELQKQNKKIPGTDKQLHSKVTGYWVNIQKSIAFSSIIAISCKYVITVK